MLLFISLLFYNNICHFQGAIAELKVYTQPDAFPRQNCVSMPLEQMSSRCSKNKKRKNVLK